MIYAAEDGDIYRDNGIRLGKVEFPAEVGEQSVITVRMNIGKLELFPLEHRCQIDGKRTKIIAIVDNENATEKALCVNNANVTGAWNKEIDIPLGNDGNPGVFDVNLYFVQPDGDIQFDDSWRDMPKSTITFSVEVMSDDDAPPPGAGDSCFIDSNCPDGYVCYQGVCTLESEVPDDPDNGSGGNGGDGDGGDDTPDDGDDGSDGNGDDDGVVAGLSGQTLLVGILGAGLWARSRRKGE